MTAFHPSLGGQVFEIDPDRLHRLRRHLLEKGLRQIAGKGLNHQLMRNNFGQLGSPVMHLYTAPILNFRVWRNVGMKSAESAQVIYPKPDMQPLLSMQLARQPGSDADVTVVVHHSAEEVAGLNSLHLIMNKKAGRTRLSCLIKLLISSSGSRS